MRIVLGHEGASPDFKRGCDFACSMMHLLQKNTLGSQQTNSCFVATCKRRRIISSTPQWMPLGVPFFLIQTISMNLLHLWVPPRSASLLPRHNTRGGLYEAHLMFERSEWSGAPRPPPHPLKAWTILPANTTGTTTPSVPANVPQML